MDEKEEIKMKTKNSLLILLLVSLFSCKTLNYQEIRIEYFFSEEVNRSINKLLSLYKDPEYKFYLIIGNILLAESCGNYQVRIGAYNDKPGKGTSSFLMRSSHYYKYGSKFIPVIFDYDFAFAFFDKNNKGKVTRMNPTGNNYTIEFDRSGKISREGL